MRDKHDLSLIREIKATADKHGLPEAFASQIYWLQVKDGVPEPDALKMLDAHCEVWARRVK